MAEIQFLLEETEKHFYTPSFFIIQGDGFCLKVKDICQESKGFSQVGCSTVKLRPIQEASFDFLLIARFSVRLFVFHASKSFIKTCSLQDLKSTEEGLLPSPIFVNKSNTKTQDVIPFN
jgi:hypothetical protein